MSRKVPPLLAVAGVAAALQPANSQPLFIGDAATIDIPGVAIDRRDVDGDGVLDIVFVDASADAMGYLPGQSGWGFGDPIALTTGGGPERSEIGFFLEAGDFSRADWSSLRFTFYQSVNGVTTEVATETPLQRFTPLDDLASGTRQLMAGDLNADGLTELLYPTQNGFAVRWGERQIFTRYQEFLLGGPVFVLPVRDYDGDGLNDILVHSVDQGGLVFYPGGPIDKLGAPVYSGVLIDDADILSALPRLLGHFDDNDSLDMVWAEAGEATFRFNIFTSHPTTIVVPMPQAGTSTVHRPFTAGDYDGDGWGDLYIPFQTQPPFPGPFRGLLWLGPVSPAPSTLEFVPHNTGFTPWVWSEDVDNDGRADLVTLGSELHVLRTRSRADLPPLGPTIGPARLQTRHTLAIDLDADGLPELLNGPPLEILNPRDFSQPAVELVNSAGFMSLPLGLSPQGGVRVAHDGNALRILDFTPDGTLAQVGVIDPSAPGSFTGLVSGDFDGDGTEDLATVFSPSDDGSNEILVYRGFNDGTYEMYTAIPTGRTVKPAAADFDGDGLTDLFVGDWDTDTARLLINRGGGVFETAADWTDVPSYWFDASDIDGDGHADVVGLIGSRPSVGAGKVAAAIWYGGPQGTFEEPRPLRLGQPLAEQAFGDFDGNGLTDIVLGAATGFGSSENAASFYLQTAPRVFEWRSTLPTTDASGVAVADLNRDGALDIVTSSGSLRQTLVHWGTPAPCPADFNGDGAADFFDLAAFVASFQAQDPDADLAEPFGVWNFFDMAAFIQIYNAGCP